MKRTVFKGTLELLLVGLPAVLALDLLYLYFAGSWYDPIPWIEITEVIVLSVVSVIYLGLFIIKIVERFHKTPSA